MNTGLSPLSNTTERIMNHKGVMASPAPRSAIMNKVSSRIGGIARKITRR